MFCTILDFICAPLSTIKFLSGILSLEVILLSFYRQLMLQTTSPNFQHLLIYICKFSVGRQSAMGPKIHTVNTRITGVGAK